MFRFLQQKAYEFSHYLELFISCIIGIVIIILSCHLLISSTGEIFSGNSDEFLTTFLGNAMSLAVGVELIKMLTKHTPSTVIEVLLFAIARQLVIEHAPTWETFLGVLAIAALFATRKYLFVNFDETEKTVYRAGQSVSLTNMLEKISVPPDHGDTLRDVISYFLTENGQTIAIGACVSFKNFALRVDNMHGDKITRVEIIKSV